MTAPRILTCAVVTLVALTACTSAPGDPVVGPPTAGGVVGAGEDAGGSTSPADPGASPGSPGSPSAVALTADEYRTQLEEAGDPIRDAVKRLAGTGGLKTLGKQLQRTNTAVDGAVTRLAALSPPPEVKTQHDGYVEALRNLSAAFGSARQDAASQQLCTGPAVLTNMDEEGSLSAVEQAADALSGYPASVISVKAPKERNRRLSNGSFVASESRSGRGSLELRNGTAQDAVVIMVRGGKKAVSVYVRKKSKFKIQGVRDGNYKIFYTFGEDWDSKARTFTRSCDFQQFGKSVRFTTTRTATHIRWSVWTITLHSVVGGNVKPKKINPNDFPG